MKGDGIRISAIGIGDADRELLWLIIDTGEGGLYMTDDLEEIPRIYKKEIGQIQRSILK